MAVIYGKNYKWTKTALTYGFTNSLTDGQFTQADAEVEFQKACDQWATPTGLNFNKGADPSTTDISITWEKIDNAGDTLGDSGHPDGANTQVKMRFDTSEEWTKNNFVLSAANFLAVALHELGHAIGLKHSANPVAVMYPLIAPFVPPVKLNTDDADGAKYLYQNTTDEGIYIVNESDRYFSWFAFNSDDAVKLSALASGNLAPGEFYLYKPVTNATGKYFIRFTDNGGGTEWAGAIVLKSSLTSLIQIGSNGFMVQVS